MRIPGYKNITAARAFETRHKLLIRRFFDILFIIDINRVIIILPAINLEKSLKLDQKVLSVSRFEAFRPERGRIMLIKDNEIFEKAE